MVLDAILTTEAHARMTDAPRVRNEEARGSNPLSSTQVTGRFRAIGKGLLRAVQQQSTSARIATSHKGPKRRCSALPQRAAQSSQCSLA
jgi:hypothetical protein